MTRTLVLTVFMMMPYLSFASEGLKPDRFVFDFGTIREGIHAPVSFTLSNSGGKSIVIKEIRTFAACVESQPLEKRRLRPGESLRLQYVFESLGYGGVAINKKIEIHTDSGESPLSLTVRGKVLPLESHQSPIGELLYNYYVLIDLRSPDAFSQGHIAGAINIPAHRFENWARTFADAFSDEAIIYLISEDGTQSDEIARRMEKEGLGVLSLVGGMAEWKRRYGVKHLITGEF